MKIILASASPRRSALLSQIGLEFSVLVSEAEETTTAAVPKRVVEELSCRKARAVYDSLAKESPEEVLVIGADTVVAADGRILGKPESPEKAIEMLISLQNRSHHVFTGVTLIHGFCDGRAPQTVTFHEDTIVHFAPMTAQEIAAYVATGDPLDKAGAYGIQGMCARYITGIEGDYNNVVGLPVSRLYQEMKKIL